MVVPIHAASPFRGCSDQEIWHRYLYTMFSLDPQKLSTTKSMLIGSMIEKHIVVIDDSFPVSFACLVSQKTTFDVRVLIIPPALTWGASR